MKRLRNADRKTRAPKITSKGRVFRVPLPADLTKLLNEWILSENDHPSPPEAIRRLVELGLKGPLLPTRAAEHRIKRVEKAGRGTAKSPKNTNPATRRTETR